MAIENGVLKPTGVLQLRGGTYAALSSQNPMLARRELCVEFDTGKIKVGDNFFVTVKFNRVPVVCQLFKS